MSSWIVFWITLLNWEFLLKCYKLGIPVEIFFFFFKVFFIAHSHCLAAVAFILDIYL